MSYEQITQLIGQLNKRSSAAQCNASLLAKIPEHTSQYIECRLDANQQLDHLYCIEKANSDLPFSLSKWERAFVEKLWLSFADIPYIWVEHDGINQAGVDAQGCIHACVDTSYLQTDADNSAFSSAQITEIVSTLACGKVSNVERLYSAIVTIGEMASLVHVSCMHSRTPASIKFFIKVAVDDVKHLLSALQWPGDPAQIEALLGKPWLKCSAQKTLSLDLKWENGLTPYLGIVSSRITLNSGFDGIGRIYSLLNENEVRHDRHITSLMHWLKPQTEPSFVRWVDIKSFFDEHQPVATKLYFGIQRIKYPKSSYVMGNTLTNLS